VLLTGGYAEAARPEAEAEGVQIIAKPYRLNELSAAPGRSCRTRKRCERVKLCAPEWRTLPLKLDSDTGRPTAPI